VSPWNFVIHDGGMLRIDLYFYERADGDMVHYGAFTSDEFFPVAALTGRGSIAGTSVRCEAAEWAVRWHSGYPLRAVDHHDVLLLCKRFALEVPEAFRAATDNSVSP
jgi:lincosamide nucleotidyltransferase A/C/D/E